MRTGWGRANWSEWLLHDDLGQAEPFSFIYLAMPKTTSSRCGRRAIRSAYADAPKARFMIHAATSSTAPATCPVGRMVLCGWLGQLQCLLPTPGNHEYRRQDSGLPQRSQFASHQRPAGLEACYYVDYQDVRIISMNTGKTG